MCALRFWFVSTPARGVTHSLARELVQIVLQPARERRKREVGGLPCATMKTRFTVEQVVLLGTDLDYKHGPVAAVKRWFRSCLALLLESGRVLSVIDCVVTLAMSSHLHTECQLICQDCCQQTRFHALRAARTASADWLHLCDATKECPTFDQFQL